MGSNFLQQFMAGWSMGQDRVEQQRRNDMMARQAEQEQYQREQDALERQQRMEQLKLQKQEIDLQMKRARFEDAQKMIDLRHQQAQLPDPTAAGAGIPEQGADLGGPPPSQVMVRPTQAVPDLMGGPDVQMPILSGAEQEELRQSELQKKMREALMLREGSGPKVQSVAGGFVEITPDGQVRFKRTAVESGPSGSFVEAVGPDGKPVLFNATTGEVRNYPAGVTPKSKSDKPSTGAERTAMSFYLRGKDALDTLESKPDPNTPSIEDRIAQSGTVQQFRLGMPSILQSADQQMYSQAKRAFTEARLRKESGAAIAAHEFVNDDRMYFVQPGDSPEVIAQKKAARQKVLDGLKLSAGRAYDEHFGTNTGAQPQSLDPAVEAALKELGY